MAAATASFPFLEARFFGGLALTYHPAKEAPPQSLPLPPTAKSQSLLAYLILHTQPPPTRERLAALFWPERPSARARRSLSTALWHIRRCFPTPALETTTQQVRFAFPAALHVDVHTFERLTGEGASLTALSQAVELYRGDFLEGFYDDWALNLRYHLQSRYLEALMRLMRGYEARGADGAALQTALRLLAADPLSEAACQTALRAYLRLGQREAALTLYRRFAAILRKELAAEPAPETSALYQRLLHSEAEAPAKDAEAEAPVSATVSLPAAEPPAAPLPPWLTAGEEPPLVGREDALQRLSSVWSETTAGRFRALWVGGEAGIGKTRLVEKFAREARARGGMVLWGRCTAWETEPYAPLGDLLRQAFAAFGLRLLEGLSPWETAALAHFAPEIGARLPAEARPSPSLLTSKPDILLRALAHALAAAGQRLPLVVMLEDLHWASREVLAWLPLLAQAAARASLLVVGTYRREELPAQAPLATLVGQWESEGLAESLPLGPLSVADLRQWLNQAPPALVRALHTHTGGNPFFVLETLHALTESGQLDVRTRPWQWQPAAGLPIPETVRQAVRLRREKLPPLARQALEVAAVLGRDFDLETWRLAWGREEDDLLAALDVLLRRGWLVEARGAFARDYAFNHHVTREVIYRGLTASRRRALHRRVAQALAQLPEQAEHSAAIAFHYFQAQAWEDAWPYLLRAGDRAAHLAATSEALTCYTQAQEARQRAADAHQQPLYDAALARKIGEVYFRRGEFTQAERHLRQALARLERPFPEGAWRVRLALLKAFGEQIARRLSPFPPRPPSEAPRAAEAEEVAVYATLGWIYTMQGRPEPYLLVSLRALNTSEAAALPDGEALAATALGFAADFIPWFGLAEHLHRRALGLLPRLSRADDIGFVHFGAAYHALLMAREDDTLHHATQAAAAYHRAGMPQRWALAMLQQGYVWLYRGDFAQAAQVAEALIRTGEALDAPTALSSGHALQGYLARWQGRWGAAEEAFRRAASLAEGVPDHMAQVENLGEAARCQMRLGQSAQAEQTLRRAEAIARAQQVSGDSLVRLKVTAAAIALMQHQKAEERGNPPNEVRARRALREAWRATRAFRPAQPEVCLLQGRLAWLQGRRSRAQRWWQRGMALATACGHTLDWGVLALEAGQRLGDDALAQAGRERLAACGVAPKAGENPPEG